MHILFLTAGYPPLLGGGERFVHALAEHLAPKGCEISIITTSAENTTAFWQGTPSHSTKPNITRLPITPTITKGRNQLLAWRKLMVMVSALPVNTRPILVKMARHIPAITHLETTIAELAQPIDLVHAFNISWEYPMVAGWQWASAHSVPFVATPFAHFGPHPRNRVALNSMMQHQRHVLQNSAAVLTLTEAENRGLAAWRVTPPLIKVIGSGYDVAPALEDIDLLRKQFGVTGQYAMFIGRNSADKGATHAMQAIVRYNQTNPPLNLVLVGQITDESTQMLAKFSEQERAHIQQIGFVSDKTKHTLLHHTQLLLLPSHSDSFGIVLLEAWAHGKPVIGADAGGIAHVITHEKDGLLAPYGNVSTLNAHITTLMSDPDLRNRMGLAGQDKLKTQFNWSAVANKVFDVYQHLLS